MVSGNDKFLLHVYCLELASDLSTGYSWHAARVSAVSAFAKSSRSWGLKATEQALCNSTITGVCIPFHQSCSACSKLHTCSPFLTGTAHPDSLARDIQNNPAVPKASLLCKNRLASLLQAAFHAKAGLMLLYLFQDFRDPDGLNTVNLADRR